MAPSLMVHFGLVPRADTSSLRNWLVWLPVVKKEPIAASLWLPPMLLVLECMPSVCDKINEIMVPMICFGIWLHFQLAWRGSVRGTRACHDTLKYITLSWSIYTSEYKSTRRHLPDYVATDERETSIDCRLYNIQLFQWHLQITKTFIGSTFVVFRNYLPRSQIEFPSTASQRIIFFAAINIIQ